MHEARHPPDTVARLLREAFDRFASRTAVVALGRDDLTYGELGRQAARTAGALAAAGLGRNSRVGLALPEGPEFAAAIVAVLGVATCVPLGTHLQRDTLAHLIDAARIDALLVADGDESAVRQVARQSGVPLLRLLSLPAGPAGSFEIVAESAVRGAGDSAPPELDDAAVVTFTSGTTSLPKIVPLTQRQLAESARNRIELSRLTAADRSLLLTPLTSSAGIRRGLLPPLLVGGSVACPIDTHGEALVDALVDMAPTQFIASPALQIALLEAYQRRRPRPRHALRYVFSGHAALPAAVRSKVESVFGVPVIEVYGMTETGSITETPFPPQRAPAGSVGRPTTLEVAVADDKGRRLGADETGEIIVRGVEVIGGYENDDDANRAAFREGWFRTGDAGRIDGDGFVYLSGRIKDIVNRGGIKIAPIEIEDALARHPDVVEAAAFALPHPTLGEDLAAAVVLRAGRLVPEGELRAFLRGSLPALKLPTRILSLPALPRGSLDKVNRRELAALVAARLDEAFEPPRPGVETRLAEVFAEALGLSRLGRNDNFFSHGGDSLRAVGVVAAIEARFGLTVAMDLLFDHPTVASLADALEAESRAAPTPAPSAAELGIDDAASAQALRIEKGNEE